MGVLQHKQQLRSPIFKDLLGRYEANIAPGIQVRIK